MIKLNPYLLFENDCRQAMEFYHDCIGGELKIQTVGESPNAKQMPGAKDKVMHSTLVKEGFSLMASDMMDKGKTNQGNTVVLSIDCSTEEEIRTIFDKLSNGGTVLYPLKTEFWGATFGQLIDRFGFRWMLNYAHPKE